MDDFYAWRRRKLSRAKQKIYWKSSWLIPSLWWSILADDTAGLWPCQIQRCLKKRLPLSKDELRFTFQHDNNLSTCHRKPHYYWKWVLQIQLDSVLKVRMNGSWWRWKWAECWHHRQTFDIIMRGSHCVVITSRYGCTMDGSTVVWFHFPYWFNSEKQLCVFDIADPLIRTQSAGSTG